MDKQELLDIIYTNKEQRLQELSRKNTTEILDILELKQQKKIPKLSKGLAKQTRGLKSLAKKYGINTDIFQILQLDKKNNTNIKNIKFNEIKLDGDIFDSSDGDNYKLDILKGFLEIEWPENIKVLGKKTATKCFSFQGLIKFNDNIIIYLSNVNSGLSYHRNIPKKNPQFFIISKLIQEELNDKIKSIKKHMEYQSFLVDDIIGHIDMNGKKTTNYSNEEIYNRAINKYENINLYFSELVLFLEQAKEFCTSLKMKYPEFQLPVDFDEDGYDNDEYKKGIIFKIIKEIRNNE